MSLRAIFDALPTAVVATDDQSVILECNQTACAWFGYLRQELLGRCLTDLLWTTPPAVRSVVDHAEVWWLGKGGRKAFPAEVTRCPFGDRAGGSLWILADVAGSRAAATETGRLLLQGREAERIRLARELHDGAIQDLIGIGFSLAAAAQTTADTDLAAGLREQKQAVQSVVRRLRSMVSELRPAGLEFGLSAALEGLCSKILGEHTGPVPRLHLELEDVEGLNAQGQLFIFRGTQEALHNCLRHAQASQIWVRLHRVGPVAELTVEDDGCGFEVPASLEDLTRGQHYGLAGVAERAQLVNGSFTLESVAGSGTKLRLALELSGAAKKRRPRARENSNRG